MTRAERRRFRLTYATWLFGIFAFFIPAATWSPASRFALTRALVERHELSIDPYASSTGDRALVAGQWFTEKAPLPSFVAAVAYAGLFQLQRIRGTRPEYRAHSVGQTPAVRLDVNRAFQQALFLCSVVTSGLAGVAVGLLSFELLRRRTRRRVALMGSVFLTLGTPLFAYATSFYGHTPAAAFLLGALVILDPRGRAPAVPPSDRALRLAGLCLASAPACEYMTAAPAALIGGWFVLRTGARVWTAYNLALGALLPVLFVGGYHALAFGAPWRTGYSFIVNPQFKAGQESGFLGITLLRPAAVYGLTFGTSRGLFYVAPVTLLGLAYAAHRAIRKDDWVARAGACALGLLFALNASYFCWWGGAATGPRHLLPATTVLALGVADALRSRKRPMRIVAALLGVLSIANVAAITAVGLEAPEFQDVLWSFAWPHLLAGHLAILPGASNLGFRLGLGPHGTVLVLVWGLLGYWHVRRLLEPNRTTRYLGEGRISIQSKAAARLR